jgi:hypothetical protein
LKASPAAVGSGINPAKGRNIMRSPRTFAVAIVTVPAMLAAVSASAQPNLPTFGSEAYRLSAVFISQAMTSSLGPVNDVQRALPPAYSKTKVLGSYDNSIAVPPLVPSMAIEPALNIRLNNALMLGHR